MRDDPGRLPSRPHCPVCDEMLDGYTEVNLGDFHPKAGDLSICAYCGTMLVFTSELLLRQLRPAEFGELSAATRTEIKRAQNVIDARRRRLN